MTARVYVNLLEVNWWSMLIIPKLPLHKTAMAHGRWHQMSPDLEADHEWNSVCFGSKWIDSLILTDSCIYMYFIVWYGEILTYIEHNSKFLYPFVVLLVPRASHQLVLLVDHAAPSASSWMPWTSLRILGTKSEWMSLGLDQGSRGTSFWVWPRFLELGNLLQVHRV